MRYRFTSYLRDWKRGLGEGASSEAPAGAAANSGPAPIESDARSP